MALWRNIGGLATIAPGATHYWEYSYSPNGRDIGVAIAAPNLLEEAINVELVAVEQGVVLKPASGDNPPPQAYTVRIRNRGTFPISYNLNIGDWQ